MSDEREHLREMIGALLRMACAVRDQAYYLQDKEQHGKEIVKPILESLQRSVEVLVAARDGIV